MATAPRLAEAGPGGVAKALAGGVAVIDIRREEEWRETGVIEGSHTVTAFTKDGALDPGFTERFAAIVPDRGSPVVLYCRTGVRTANLGAALAAQGYADVGHLAGGIFRWLEEGRPVVEYGG